jgi:AcrR family transcriptional regulator
MSSKSRSRDATRQKIVDAAYDLFYEKGFNRVSVDEIAAKSGITKRTLYDHFESKDAMLAVVLDYHAQLAINRIRKYEKRYDGDAPKLLSLLFSELNKWSRKPGWTGSGFSRLSMELADLPGHPARKAAHGHKREVEAWYREMLVLADVPSPHERAKELAILVEGAAILTLIHADRSYFDQALSAALHLVSRPATNDKSR